MLFVWWMCYSPFYGGMFGLVVCFPTIYVRSLLKSKWNARCETTRTKEHSKQSSTNNIKFIYQENTWKRKHFKYSNIVCWIFLCVCVVYVTNTSLFNIPVCVRMCVLTRILREKTKYWKCPVDYKMYVG